MALLNGLADAAHHFLICGIRRAENGPQGQGDFIHAIDGPWRTDASSSGGNVHAGQTARVSNLGVQNDRGGATKVLDGGLRHGGAGIRAEDQGGVIISAHEQVDGGKLAGVEAGIAAREGHAEGVGRGIAEDDIRSGDIAVAAHRHGHEFGEGI